jgi:RNA-directed DNA polymerase
MQETKPYNISKQVVLKAFKRVKENRGTYGIDNQSIGDFEKNLKDNLYKIWNRMSSGTYFPKPVKAVAIPKKSGGERILGIPTVEDRVAQMVAKMYFEPKVEEMFYDDSYGYRPNKSAIQGVGKTRERCWDKDWVLEYDIKGLFDNIRHDYLIEMVKRHADEKWVVLYVERWLKTPFKRKDGKVVPRTAGTPQGGVISPVLANLFLHYAFDDYMVKEFPSIPWARYADDGVTHCSSLKQAKYLLKKLQERFKKFGLELNLEKTKIIYCKDGKRKGNYPNNSFDFLGYTFRTRGAKDKNGKVFLGFLPGMAEKAKKSVRKVIRGWRLQAKVDKSIEEIAEMCNKQIQGWINYYKHFYISEIYEVMRYINLCLVKWVRKKHKKLKGIRRATARLRKTAEREKQLFPHWKIGILPR